MKLTFKTNIKLSRILVGSIVGLVGVEVVVADSGVWTGASGGSWGEVTNWSSSPGAVPGVGNVATWSGMGNGNTTIDLGLGVGIGTIIFETAGVAGYTIGGGAVGSQTVTLDNGGGVTMSELVAAEELLNARIILGNGAVGGGVLTNQSLTNGLTFAGGIEGGVGGVAGVKTLSVGGDGGILISGVVGNGGGSSLGLVKTGLGTLVLGNGGNSYSGVTTITAGTIRLGGSGSGVNSGLGTAVGGTVVGGSGAALDLGGFSLGVAEALSLTGTGMGGGSGALTNSGGASIYSGVVTISGAGTSIGGVGEISLTAGLGTTANSLVKVGVGKLILGVNSLRTGNTQIDGGTLRIGDATAMGVAATSLTINHGGTWEIGTVNVIANGGAINLNNGGVIADGLVGNVRIDKAIVVQNSASAVVSFYSGGSAGNVMTINGGGNTRLSGGALGARLQVTGLGEVRLGESGQGRTSTVTGDWYLQGGQLRIRADGSWGAVGNDIYFQGGKLVIDAALTLGSGRVLDFGNGNGGMIDTTGGNLTLGTAGQMVGANVMVKSGANLLILGQANGGYSGEIRVMGGGIRANDGVGLSVGSLLTLGGGVMETGANLARVGGSGSGNMQITGGVSGFSANGANVQVAFGSLGSPAGVVWGVGAFAPSALVLNAGTATHAIDFRSAIDLGAGVRSVQVDGVASLGSTLSGNVVGSGGGLTKLGVGTLILSGVNSYDGGTNVNGGMLVYGRSGARPGVGTTTVAGGAGLGLGVGGAGYFGGSDLANLFANTLAGVSMNANSGVGIDTTAGNFDTGGAIFTGVRAVTKMGANILTLSGASTYSGPTAVNAGAVRVGIGSVSGVSGALGNQSAVTLANGSGVSLDVSGYGTQIGSLAGGGALGGGVSLGGNTLTVGGDNTSTSYAGVISSSAGVSGVSVYKVGSGQWQLDGTNTYTGKTVIDGGKIYATENGGSLADAKLGAVPGVFQADNVTILNGGTLNLASGTDGRALSATRGIYLGSGRQTINTGGGDFYINGVISGPGGLYHGNLSGGYRRLYLTAANTFTGDTGWDASGSSSNYGGIEMSGNGLALQNSAVDADAVGSWLGITTTGGVLQLGGLIGGNRSLANLTSNGTFSGLVLNPTVVGVTKTFTNVIGGTNEAGTSVTKTGLGTQALNGLNTYSGATSIRAGVLRINTMQNLGGAANSLGQPTTVGAGTIGLGWGASVGTLVYTGLGGGSDRVINLAGTTGGGVLEVAGASGVWALSGGVTASGLGVKTLTLQGSSGGVGLLSGVIGDSLGGATGLMKVGSGEWRLDGANVFSGDTVMSAGTLTVGNLLGLQNSAVNYGGGILQFGLGIGTPTLGGLKGGTDFSWGSNVSELTLRVGAGVTNIYGGILGSEGVGLNLVKTGVGTQVLGGVSAVGTVTVGMGKLFLNGNSVATAIGVNDGGTLGGMGSAESAVVTVGDQGRMEAGYAGVGGLRVGGVEFVNSGVIAVSNIGNYGSSGAVRVLNFNGLSVGGGIGSVVIALSGVAPASGTAHLVEYLGSIGGIGAGFGAFVIDASGLSAGPRALFTLVNPSGYLDVNFSVDQPVWSGLGGGAWVTASSLVVAPPTNWNLASNGAVETNFLVGDAVRFDDTAVGGTVVSVSGGAVVPASVTFANETKNYTLQGAFGVEGSGVLTKSGAGKLTVLNANGYSGGTVIQGGTMEVGDGGMSGSLGGGGVINEGVLVLNRAGVVTLGNAISGSGSLILNGLGEVRLEGVNSYLGGTVLNAGLLTLGGASALGGEGGGLRMNGGDLDSGVVGLVLGNHHPQIWEKDFRFVGTNDLDLGGGAVALGSGVGGRVVTVSAGNLRVGGVIADGVASGLVKQGAGNLILGGLNQYSGGTTVNEGTLTVASGGGLGSGSLAVNNLNAGVGTLVKLSLNESVSVGSLGSSVGVALSGVNRVGIEVATGKVLTVNQAVLGIFGGTIEGGGRLVKGGVGALTLSGANTYSGGTVLNQGILSVESLSNSGASGLGNSGTITVNGGTLRYTGLGLATSDRFSITGGNSTFEITESTGKLLITQQFTNATITKEGPGTLGFGGNVYYTGNLGNINLAVKGGVVDLGSTVTDPAFTATVLAVNQVDSGATLRLGNAQGRQFVVSGGFHLSGGTFDLNGNTYNYEPEIEGTGTISNSAAGSAVLSIHPSGVKTFSGGIVDGVGVVGVRFGNQYGFGPNPDAVWILAGNNTYSGATEVGVGTLRAGSATAFSANSGYVVNGTLDLAGWNNGVGSLSGVGSVSLGGGRLTIGGNQGSGVFSGGINGAGVVVKMGSGTLTLGGANGYSGGTVVEAGTLTVSNGGTLGASGGDLTLNNLNVGVGTAVVLNVNGSVTVGTLRSTIGVASEGVNSVVVNIGSGKVLTINQLVDANFGGTIVGNGGLALGGQSSGTLTLSGLNGYYGETTIVSGALRVDDFQGLGYATSAVKLGGGSEKGTLIYGGLSGIFSRGLTVMGGGGELDNLLMGEMLTIEGGAIVGEVATGLVLGGAGDVTVNGDVDLGLVGGGLTKRGLGTLNLAGGVQNYGTLTAEALSGETRIDVVLGVGGASVVANADVRFGSVSQSLGSLSIGSGAVVTFGSGPGSAMGGGVGKLGVDGGAMVPEPGAMGLLLVGLLGVLGVGRRRG